MFWEGVTGTYAFAHYPFQDTARLSHPGLADEDADNHQGQTERLRPQSSYYFQHAGRMLGRFLSLP